jgi:hypothetical protein
MGDQINQVYGVTDPINAAQLAAAKRAPDAAAIRSDRTAAGDAAGACRLADAIATANVSGKED